MRQLECDCVRFEAVSFFFLLAKFYAYWSRHVKVNSDSGTFFSDTPCSVLLLLCAEPMDPPENFRIVGEPFNSTFAEFSWDSVDRSPERIQGFFRGYRVSFWVTYTHSTHYDIIPCATSCTFEFRSHFSPSWLNSCAIVCRQMDGYPDLSFSLLARYFHNAAKKKYMYNLYMTSV